MSKSSYSSSRSSSSSSSQVDSAFDRKFATSFANFCIAQFENNDDKLRKLILTAPLRDEPWTPSVVWNSMQTEFNKDERPRAGDDKTILDLYLRNLDAIKENLKAKIVTRENINDAQRRTFTSSINEAFEILENVRSHEPKISLGKVVYDAKQDGTASMIKMVWMDDVYYYGEVKYNQPARQNIFSRIPQPVEICEGNGVLRYDSGDIYDGDWRDGAQNGKGVLRYASGDIYDGYWRDGNFHGQGILTYQNGDKYVGNFANNQRSGEGTLTRKDGTIIQQGHWEGETLEESSMSNERDFGLHGNDDETNPGIAIYSPTARRVVRENEKCIIS